MLPKKRRQKKARLPELCPERSGCDIRIVGFNSIENVLLVILQLNDLQLSVSYLERNGFNGKLAADLLHQLI